MGACFLICSSTELEINVSVDALTGVAPLLRLWFSRSAATETRLVSEAEAREKIQRILGYTFKDPALLTAALSPLQQRALRLAEQESG